MRIYLSSVPSYILDLIALRWPSVKLNILRSYAVEKEDTIKIAINRPASVNSLILDSGTYTIANKPDLIEDLDVQSYKAFLKQYGSFFDYYFNFDEVHGDEGEVINWANMQILSNLSPSVDGDVVKNLKPIPVLQNLEEVNNYCQLKDVYPIIAIGSTCLKNDKDVKAAVSIMAEHKIKVHLFGKGSYTFLKDKPAWSCDCSSFAQWNKIKRIIYFNEHYEKEFIFSVKEKTGSKPNEDYLFNDEYHCMEYEIWLRSIGIEINEVYNDTIRQIANCLHYHRMEKIITDKHIQDGIIK